MTTEAGAPDGPAAGRPWLEVSIAAPLADRQLLLVDALHRAGARLVERSGPRVTAHFLGTAADAATTAGARRLLRPVEAAARASTGVAELELTWAWRRGPPAPLGRHEGGLLRVSERIGVARSGTTPDPTGDAPPILIRLHPGVAFGGADHPTTRACLRRLERLVREGDRIIDVGTGSGVLAIAAALLGARRVVAIEADEVACEEARRNAALNGVVPKIRVRHRTADRRRLRWLRPRDGVVANLEADTLRPLLPALRRLLKPSGWMLVSGVTRPEREAVLAAAVAAGLTPVAEEWDGGWWTVTFRPQKPLRPLRGLR